MPLELVDVNAGDPGEIDDVSVAHARLALLAIVHVATARVALHEARPEDARAALACADRLWPQLLELCPQLGFLADDARELRGCVEATTGSAGAWAMSLTAAELRLLPFLATHLTFPEIAGRLFVSRNTVKTQAVAIYRKLGASSRSEAIARAIEVGLLESSIYPPPADLTLAG